MGERAWAWLVARVGGVRDIGPATLCIHDRGALIAWRGVLVAEWRMRTEQPVTPDAAPAGEVG